MSHDEPSALNQPETLPISGVEVTGEVVVEVAVATTNPPTLPPPLVARRNTVGDTWRWLWRDTLGRVVPFYAAVGLYAWRTRCGSGGLGLRRERWVRDALVGTAYGLPLALVAAEFRRRVIPTYRLPTRADQILQTAFYFALNAPAEELFFRAMIQSVAIRACQRVGLRPVLATGTGYAFATALYGSYHRLGGWSWRSIAGVSAAGLLFGALYQWHPRQSLLPSIVAHACATAGFLSWGDVYLHWRARRHQRPGE